MLEAARAKIESEEATGIELRRGEAGALPLADAEVDAALAHMVLHYLPSPGEAVREMARVVRPGGAVVAVDFVRHGHEWMRQELGVAWLGFAEAEVRAWFADAGLAGYRCEVHQGTPGSRDLPATFIASGRRPGG
jgi:ArsR family transcriptional regulator